MCDACVGVRFVISATVRFSQLPPDYLSLSFRHCMYLRCPFHSQNKRCFIPKISDEINMHGTHADPERQYRRPAHAAPRHVPRCEISQTNPGGASRRVPRCQEGQSSSKIFKTDMESKIRTSRHISTISRAMNVMI